MSGSHLQRIRFTSLVVRKIRRVIATISQKKMTRYLIALIAADMIPGS